VTVVLICLDAALLIPTTSFSSSVFTIFPSSSYNQKVVFCFSGTYV
jgi:hypothetical protein